MIDFDTFQVQISKRISTIERQIRELFLRLSSAFIPFSGWIPSTSTWTYSSVDGVTGVINTSADETGNIQVGDKIRYDQTTTQYAIVTAISVTQITAYHGTDYALINAAITNPRYSHVKKPLGFPASPAKWSVSVSDPNNRSSAVGTNNFQNLNAADSIVAPIGLWYVNFSALVGGPKAASGTIQPAITLSTTTNSATDANTTMLATAQPSTFFTQTFRLTDYLLSVAAKTTLYLNVASLSFPIDNINTYGATSTTQIWLVCAYL